MVSRVSARSQAQMQRDPPAITVHAIPVPPGRYTRSLKILRTKIHFDAPSLIKKKIHGDRAKDPSWGWSEAETGLALGRHLLPLKRPQHKLICWGLLVFGGKRRGGYFFGFQGFFEDEEGERGKDSVASILSPA